MKKPRWPESQRDVEVLTPADHAARTQAAIDWINTTGQKLKTFPMYGAMVAREASVAIGWEEWPSDWPRD